MGGSYQQEVDLASLFKDVCSEYVQVCMVPQQLPNLIDRAIRVALAESCPTCIIVPSDVFDMGYEPPEHAFKQVPSSLGLSRARAVPEPDVLRSAADLLNAGERVAMLVGQGARDCVDELTEVAELLGPAWQSLVGKGCTARRSAVGHRFDRSVGYNGELASDDGLRHVADGGVQFSVQPVPAEAWTGAWCADRPVG